jgi:hypothetical protein
MTTIKAFIGNVDFMISFGFQIFPSPALAQTAQNASIFLRNLSSRARHNCNRPDRFIGCS